MPNFNKYVPIHPITTKEIHPTGFDILDLKSKSGKEYDGSVPHRHNFFELLFFFSGNGNHEIDFKNYTVENSSIHFVAPGQIHQLRSKNENGYVLCFIEDFIPLNQKENLTDKFPYFNPGYGVPVLKLTKTQSGEMLELITAVVQEFKLKGNETEVLRSYLNIILVRIKQYFLVREKNKTSGYEKNQKIVRFKKLINNHFIQHKSVSYYAGQLSISPNHLNALCKKQEGKTATNLIQERIMLEAKRMLYATEMSIKEISFELRFEDVAYFNRFFKKHMKITPGSYREALLKNR